ncbi:hypothetical protein STCU_09723 [Strigomonas culicis]|uniref:Roc domain-containing protein n=1 Tax=Strigomonas culicis TaxID=28005 RepID=S9UWH3_9TRYP|nr:hypothetical protein STCU_09723 [Strigomonas culicis]|eukprot:EPY18886.1 hypothetical protein STCU_09723 [Strigomonas culicis]
MHVDGDALDLIISDFAGQESYHSHTCFLTRRSIFALVWKISAVEQDFHGTGISANEEERLYKWIAEVYAKFPTARIVLVATHLDELRVQAQHSVEAILTKVEKKLRSFMDRITPEAQTRQAPNRIVGNFAVSCKSRLIVAAGDRQRHLSGQTISTLLQYLTEIARDDCMADKEYPSAIISGRHAKLLDNILRLKECFPQKLIMPIGELVLMGVEVGIESDAELLQVARLLHSWDVLYVFHPYRLEENAVVMLRPQWLSRMAAALFSYAHILRTPLHLRSFIGGLEYIVSHAEQADMYLARRGYIRWPLARVLFAKPLADFVRHVPEDSDTLMCLELLQSMELLYAVQVQCDEYSVLEEETPTDPTHGRVVTSDTVTRYFVPSLAPFNVPAVLRRLAPLLFHGGVPVRITFNLLPDELWWRMQCRLHTHIHLISVHQPVSAMVTDELQEEEELLTDGYRIKEADDEHNRWRDAMWLQGDGCRVFLCREGRDAISIYAAEVAPGRSDDMLRDIVFALTDLLREYEGVKHKVRVGCPAPSCSGWLDERAVETTASVTCPTCGRHFDAETIATSGGGRQFSTDLLTETGELLSYSLPYASCVHLCSFLGIPYMGPVPATTAAPAEANAEAQDSAPHTEYLHALDKVVQAALFQYWMTRVEEMEKRKRMQEVEASPVLY